MRLLDVSMVVWVAAWIGIGVWVAIDVSHLARLTVVLGHAALALRDTGSALSALKDVPFVGSDLARLARNVDTTANSASANVATARSSVTQLAYLLGVVIAVIPSVPALAVYLPFRLRRSRDVRAVRAALDGRANRTLLRRHLAQRALFNLPYHQLADISDDPWADLERGRLDRLAGAELERLGFDPHRLDDPIPPPAAPPPPDAPPPDAPPPAVPPPAATSRDARPGGVQP